MRRARRELTYGTVVVLVLGTYAVSLAVRAPASGVVAALLQVATVRLSLVHSGAGALALRLADAVLGVAALLVLAVAAAPLLGFEPPTGAVYAVYVLNAVLYLVAPVSILRDIATSDRVDGGAVLASVAAYLQAGLFFAFVYRGIAITTSAFSRPVDTSDLVFFSFVTLTTTGYGDVVPVGWAARTTAVVEVVVGQFFLVAAVAKIVTAWVPRRRDPG